MQRSARKINYYGIQTFKWTEKEFTIREIVEDYAHYLPFIIMVTEGYSSSRLEIADGEVYWIHEVTTQPCIIVRNHQGKYFSIPDCYQQKIVPLREESPGFFVSACNGITLDEFRKKGQWRFFRFLGTYTKEVFDGANESQMIKIGRLEIVDTHQEKFLVGHPVLGQPYYEIRTDIRRLMEETFTGAIYPIVTLIPVYVPLKITIAVCMNGKSDHKFFKAMLELREFANLCNHDYSKQFEEDAEIMLFNKPPVDNVYDYIQVMPIRKHRKSDTSLGSAYSTIDDDDDDNSSSDSHYELIDSDHEEPQESRSLSHRYEPIAYSSEMDPIVRFNMLKKVYETGVLPPDTDPPEEPAPEQQERAVSSGSKYVPPIPKRGHRSYNCRLPPPVSKPRIEPPQTDVDTPSVHKTSSRETDKDYCEWKILKPANKQPKDISSSSSKASPSPFPLDDQSSVYGLSGCIKKKTTHAKPVPDRKQHQPDESSTRRKQTQGRITCLKDIPSDVAELSVDQLTDCLILLNMSEHVPAFKRSLIDGELLCSLTVDLLTENFNFNKFDANKLICFSRGWRPKLH